MIQIISSLLRNLPNKSLNMYLFICSFVYRLTHLLAFLLVYFHLLLFCFPLLKNLCQVIQKHEVSTKDQIVSTVRISEQFNVMCCVSLRAEQCYKLYAHRHVFSGETLYELNWVYLTPQLAGTRNVAMMD